MIRTLAGLLVLAMAGLPVLAGPSWVLMPLGVAAAGLGLAGVLRYSVRLVAASAGLSLVEFALALWLSAAPAVLIAIGLGVLLALALDVADFAARFSARRDPSRSQRGTPWPGRGIELAPVRLGGKPVVVLAEVFLQLAAEPLQAPPLQLDQRAQGRLAVGDFEGRPEMAEAEAGRRPVELRQLAALVEVVEQDVDRVPLAPVLRVARGAVGRRLEPGTETAPGHGAGAAAGRPPARSRRTARGPHPPGRAPPT
jgi:hypothetical protein